MKRLSHSLGSTISKEFSNLRSMGSSIAGANLTFEEIASLHTNQQSSFGTKPCAP